MTEQRGLDDDVVLYAELAAELSGAPRPRDVVLADHGLDEDAWAEIDSRWQDRLSVALASAAEGIPPLVAAHAEAFARAQHSLGGVPMPLARFAEATAIVQRGGDVGAGLARLGVDLAAYLTASRHYTTLAAHDRAVADALRAAMSGVPQR